MLVTRKGAIRAGLGELGIVPGSMGAKSYIVRGKGNSMSFSSCAHGAGRRMSRSKAKQAFTKADLAEQTSGVECRKDAGVIDEIPGAYEDIDAVMANQSDLGTEPCLPVSQYFEELVRPQDGTAKFRGKTEEVIIARHQKVRAARQRQFEKRHIERAATPRRVRRGVRHLNTCAIGLVVRQQIFACLGAQAELGVGQYANQFGDGQFRSARRKPCLLPAMSQGNERPGTEHECRENHIGVEHHPQRRPMRLCVCHPLVDSVFLLIGGLARHLARPCHGIRHVLIGKL